MTATTTTRQPAAVSVENMAARQQNAHAKKRPLKMRIVQFAALVVISLLAVSGLSTLPVANASVIDAAAVAAAEATKEMFYQYHMESSMSYDPCYSSKSSKGSKGKGKGGPKGYHPHPHHHPHHPHHHPHKKSVECKESKGSKGSKTSKSKGKGYYSKYPPGKGKGMMPEPEMMSGGIPTGIPGPPTPTMEPGSGTPGPGPVLPTAPTTAPPSDEIVQTLTPFEIAYTIAQTDIPSISDYDGVTAVTDRYISESFNEEFAGGPSIVSFIGSTTQRTGEDFNLNQPVQVFYLTNVSFPASSDTIPGIPELDNFLQEYFTGGNADVYLAALQALSAEDNLFGTTSAFTFSFNLNSQEPPGASPTASDTAKTAGIAVAAAAGGFVVLITALVVARRRHLSEEEEGMMKYGEDGHMTVAGETFAGTISLDSRSVRRVEAGMMSSSSSGEEDLHHRAQDDEDEDDGDNTCGANADDNSQWEGYAFNNSTPQFRNTSPTGTSSEEGNVSDGSEGSGETVDTPRPSSIRSLENVDI